MTACQKIKREMMLRAKSAEYEPGPLDTAEQVDAAFADFEDLDLYWESVADFRGGEVETDLPSERSRHYESKAVAAKLSDGSWVGWTYWYGGGKHGEPGSVPWMASYSRRRFSRSFHNRRTTFTPVLALLNLIHGVTRFGGNMRE